MIRNYVVMKRPLMMMLMLWLYGGLDISASERQFLYDCMSFSFFLGVGLSLPAACMALTSAYGIYH